MRKIIALCFLSLLATTNLVAEGWIIPLSTSLNVVDLTHTLGPSAPYLPGGEGYRTKRLLEYRKGYYMNKFSMGEHTGTHVDAPAHFVPHAQTVDTIPVGTFVGEAVVISARHWVLENPDFELTLQHVKDWEEKNRPFRETDIVLLRTDWSKRWPLSGYLNEDQEGVLHFPGYSYKAAKYLIEKRNVLALGIDTISTDPGRAKRLRVHKVVHQANKYQIENLTDLDQLPTTGAMLIVAPLKLQVGSGSPARVFAVLPY